MPAANFSPSLSVAEMVDVERVAGQSAELEQFGQDERLGQPAKCREVVA
jgi:hypothetical protein